MTSWTGALVIKLVAKEPSNRFRSVKKKERLKFSGLMTFKAFYISSFTLQTCSILQDIKTHVYAML